MTEIPQFEEIHLSIPVLILANYRLRNIQAAGEVFLTDFSGHALVMNHFKEQEFLLGDFWHRIAFIKIDFLC